MHDINIYLSGQKLYGDDFSEKEIEEWFNEENSAYADLGAKNKYTYTYAYHELNKKHAYSKLSKNFYENALGIGAAYGDEFKPIINKIQRITILEPSDSFCINERIANTPCKYVKPNIKGNMPFEDDSFDLITCFGALHHIPNVSHVINECYRVLCSDGEMLIREPIVSMGDWTMPRAGLTKNERGIPYAILYEIISEAGFLVKSRAFCDFSIISRVANKLGVAAYNNMMLTNLDSVLSGLFSRNLHYHRKNFMDKLSPASSFFVLKKECI